MSSHRPSSAAFDLQGHRGAYGLLPENTLPGYELALDNQVTSIEVDVHLCQDGTVVLTHDAEINSGCHLALTNECLQQPLWVADLGMEKLRGFRVHRTRDRCEQQAPLGPLARRFAKERGWDPCGLLALDDLFAFITLYAGVAGHAAGKSKSQRRRAAEVIIDVEIKRSPEHPEWVNDDFDGVHAGRLERAVLESITKAGRLGRCRVRSFDQRSVRAIAALESGVQTALLLERPRPADVVSIVKATGAAVCAPHLEIVDARLVDECHRAGILVIPWTVNELVDCRRLLDIDVDGLTTDYPDRLAAFLVEQCVSF